MSLPLVHVTTLSNGFEINTIVSSQLPVVHATLVVRSGAASDPVRLPGLAAMVAGMLKEGTTVHTRPEIIEAIEFLGADLWVEATTDTTEIGVQALSAQWDEVMNILSEVVNKPAFSETQFQKLKKRTLDRLVGSMRKPLYLARRTFMHQLYGDHPYAT